MDDYRLEQLKEIQVIFDSLKDDTLKPLENGTYVARLTNVVHNFSKKGTGYVRLDFDIEGYQPISKFLMTESWNKQDNTRNKEYLFKQANALGKVTNVLDDAVEFIANYVKHNIFKVKLIIENIENDYPDILLRKYEGDSN